MFDKYEKMFSFWSLFDSIFTLQYLCLICNGVLRNLYTVSIRFYGCRIND